MNAEPDPPRILSEDEAKSVAYEFAVLTEATRETRQRLASLRERLLSYMDEQGLSRIAADRAGMAIERQARAGRKMYDVAAMPSELVIAANTFAVLRIDVAAAKHVSPSVLSEMERYATLGEPTYALTVKPVFRADEPLP